MFVSLQFKIELKKEDKEKPIKLMGCLASSEGSPPPPCPWKGFAKRPFSSEAIVGGRGVG
jgi:hypothetical protein